MGRNLCALGLVLLLAAGCATTPPPPAVRVPRTTRLFPADALVTQRGILTARGRQFALNGYVALSASRGKRLLVTEMFGNVLADVLIKPDGTVAVMRSSRLFRPAWIKRYVAGDLDCVFSDAPPADCPVTMPGPGHFVIKRRWYTLDLHVVETKPGPQPAEMFDDSPVQKP